MKKAMESNSVLLEQEQEKEKEKEQWQEAGSLRESIIHDHLPNAHQTRQRHRIGRRRRSRRRRRRRRWRWWWWWWRRRLSLLVL